MLYNSYFWDRGFPEYGDLRPLAYHLWDVLFKEPVDTLPETSWEFTQYMRDYYFSCEWNEVFDLIEAVLEIPPRSGTKEEFTASCNSVLNDEISRYRLIKNQIAPVDSEVGKEAIEDAIKGSSGPVNQHLVRALELLSDRRNPDYRNSIKESISAVEALCKLITEESNTTLGKAVNLISNSGVVSFHPSFAQALKKLYGWTNDADGIRHSLMDDSSLSQEDARFMLVTCSAITSYLTVKADKAGVNLRGSNDSTVDQGLRHRSHYDDFAPPPDDFAPPPLDVGEIPF